MADVAGGSQSGLTKGARITGDQRSSLGASFGERYAGGESIRSIAQDTGRSYGFVHGVLKESGASLRGRGGATRGPRRTPAEPVTAAPARPKVAKAEPAATLVDQVADKVEKVADRATDKVEKVGAKAKAKSAKDDKAKKKPDAKKSGKKGKKG